MNRFQPLKQLWLHPLGHGFTLALLSLLAGCGKSISFGGEPAIALQYPQGVATNNPAVPPVTAQPYGVEGGMSEADLVTLMYLQFPQSYDAVKDRFGFPAKRDETADYYKIEGTNHWVAVWYEGDQATGYQFSE